ncbi:MAG: hypothetical protein WBX15_04225 [Thermoanaerobaculia bacterium]
MTPTRRRLLGKRIGFVTRERIYRVEDALEIDESDHYMVTRKRVFFDDVLLVTRHQKLGAAFLSITGSLALLFVFVSIAVGLNEPIGGTIVFALGGLPFCVVFLIRLIFKVDVISVFGRRTMAQMYFPFRKKQAQEVFNEICAATRAAQRRRTAERPLSAPEPAPPPPLPLPESNPSV